jgi:acyl-CoA reductase-like NAD-dependent aldehyde dehydrogenase
MSAPGTASTIETVADVIEVYNPADGRLVGRVPAASSADVAAVVARLRAEQPAWEELGPRGRKRWLLALQDWIFDNNDRIADVLQEECAKARVDASMEGPLVADTVGYYARRAEKFLAPERRRPHGPLGLVKKLSVAYRPYPVVGVITPWNYPFAMPGMDSAPALAAGAAVLIKPSEVTPLGGLLLAEGWSAIGAPPVLAVVTGARETGAAVVAHVDYVQFTGSTATGRQIGVQAAQRLIPCSLELGGKDPAIVLADADLDRAANGIAWGGMFNSGQTCVSVERVYVEEPVYDAFVEKLVAKVAAIRQGQDDRSASFDVGALSGLAHRRIVARHVAEAQDAGARVLTGGAAGVGSFFDPTVLVDVDHTMSCIREETFGPTLPVIKVTDADEAVRLANDSEYGLSATVWTRDLARGKRIARRIEAGAVNINDVYANLFNLALPMGGWKASGIGARLGGAHGVRKYCRTQAMTVPRVPTAAKELLWYPYDKRKVAVAVAALRAGSARGRRRLGR